MLLEERIEKALDIAFEYSEDASAHKVWIIDQIIRALLSEDEYLEWVNQWEIHNEYQVWDEGIAPWDI